MIWVYTDFPNFLKVENGDFSLNASCKLLALKIMLFSPPYVLSGGKWIFRAEN